MDFHHLRCFVLVAEEMNFRRAADRLGVTQPTVTKRVAALETDLGLDLFVRGDNRIIGLAAQQSEPTVDVLSEDAQEMVDDAGRLHGHSALRSAELAAAGAAPG